MSFANWLDRIKSAEKSSAIIEKTRRVHYKFPDGQIMVEEYNMDTGVLQRRAWKREKALGRDPEWEVELGDIVRSLNSQEDKFVVRESATEPVLTKRLTKLCIEWRIRNLPYPLKTYSVTASPDECAITVRTTNRKYYKKILIPELTRCGLLPSQQLISIQHLHNTLIITYQKPPLLLEMEEATLIVLKSVPTETDDPEEETDDFEETNALLKQLMGEH